MAMGGGVVFPCVYNRSYGVWMDGWRCVVTLHTWHASLFMHATA